MTQSKKKADALEVVYEMSRFAMKRRINWFITCPLKGETMVKSTKKGEKR